MWTRSQRAPVAADLLPPRNGNAADNTLLISVLVFFFISWIFFLLRFAYMFLFVSQLFLLCKALPPRAVLTYSLVVKLYQ